MWRAMKASWSSSAESVGVARFAARVPVSFIVIVSRRPAASSSFVADRRLVGLRVEQAGKRSGIGRLELEEPRRVCVLVHLFRRVGERRIDRDDLACNRRIDVGGGLD